jgi:hypothetical protein
VASLNIHTGRTLHDGTVRIYPQNIHETVPLCYKYQHTTTLDFEIAERKCTTHNITLIRLRMNNAKQVKRYGFELSRISHFVDNRLTDGGEVVSFMRRPASPPQDESWYSFLLEIASTPPGAVCGWKD